MPTTCPYQDAIARAASELLNAQRSGDTQAIEVAALRLKQRKREADHHTQASMRRLYEELTHQEHRLQRAA